MIQINDSCVGAIRAIRLEKQDPSLCLRLSVRNGGCSGLSYEVNLVSSPHEGDTKIDKDGVPFYVDASSLAYLEELTLDFFDKQTSKGFTFTNPKATATCGCGTSFSIT